MNFLNVIKQFFTITILFISTVGMALSQPPCSGSLFPSSSFTAPADMTSTLIKNNHRAGDYYKLTGVDNGQAYTFESVRNISNGSSDYITLRDQNNPGTVLAHGKSPLAFTGTAVGDIQVHNHLDDGSCGTETAPRTTKVSAGCFVPNDFCSNPETLNTTGTCKNGTTICATGPQFTPISDVWYEVTAPSDGIYIIEATTLLGIACEIVVHDDQCNQLGINGDSPMNIPMQNGQTITLRIVTKDVSNNPTEEEFTICATQCNSSTLTFDCANAQPLSVGALEVCNSSLVQIDCGGLSSSFNPSPCSGFTPKKDFWFEVVVPSLGDITIETINSGVGIFETKIQAYSSCTLSHGTHIGSSCPDPDFTKLELTGLSSGATVFVRVMTEVETGSFRICAYEPCVPDNDLCVNATPYTLSTSSCNILQGSTICATPTISGNSPDVWYSFTPITTGVYNILVEAQVSNQDFAINVYSGSCSFFVLLASEPTSLNVDLIANDPYLIKINTQSNSQTGDFDLCITECNPRGYNYCNENHILSLNGTDCSPFSFNIDCLSKDLGPSSCNVFNAIGRDAFFITTVPPSGNVAVKTLAGSGGVMNTSIQAFLPSASCNTLAASNIIACNDNDPDNAPFSKLEMYGLNPGDEIKIRIFINTNGSSNPKSGGLDVCAYDPCPLSLSLMGTNNGTNTGVNDMDDNESQGTITSTQQIAATAIIDYDSATEIILDLGFETFLGAVFEAFIDGCNNGMGGSNLMDDTVNNNEN